MDFDNSIFKVSVPRVFLPKVGQPLWLTIPRDRCFVFAAERSAKQKNYFNVLPL
jgi:iron(III) transport system ATP-binding protein